MLFIKSTLRSFLWQAMRHSRHSSNSTFPPPPSTPIDGGGSRALVEPITTSAHAYNDVGENFTTRSYICKQTLSSENSPVLALIRPSVAQNGVDPGHRSRSLQLER